MRVSGRKLRLAVGTGFAALMLVVGVSSVGATAPGAVGNIDVVVTSSGASALGTANTTAIAATYRDAVVITNTLSGAGGLGANYDECVYTERSGANVNQGTPQQPKGNLSSTDVTDCGNTNPIIQPASYPLWAVEVNGGKPYFVIPPTSNNKANPGRTYAIETFR